MNSRPYLSQVAFLAGGILLATGIQTFAFTLPAISTRGVDASAPLDTSANAQAKVGGLLLNTGGATNGLIVQSGNVGIGTTSPGQMLSVSGIILASGGFKFPDGTIQTTSASALSGGVKMANNLSAPFACDAAHDSVWALTSFYTMCLCKSGTGWVSTTNGTTACVWGPTVNGTCGSANGVYSATTPSANLCTTGSTSAVTGGASGTPWTWTCGGANGGTIASCSAPSVSATAPTALTLAQTSNHRDFTVSWTAGNGNGGAGGCRLQYYNGSSWVNLTYATYNCDATTANAAAQLNGDNFAATTWNATGLQVRLERISDSASVGAFPQKVTCSSIAGSGVSTPLIDEDCNTQWDNTSGGTPYTYDFSPNASPDPYCTTSGGTVSPGQAYSCPMPPSCNGYPTGAVNMSVFTYNGTINMYAQSDTTCSSANGSQNTYQTIIGPNSANGSAPAYSPGPGVCYNIVPGYYKWTSLGSGSSLCYWNEQRTGYTASTYY